ncbi:MAG TPA: hypothetical protein VK011_05835 [Acidimicrobiia bacterium]|nr:hypothetical protein [Acidimicrobiia bacterium]
MTAEPPPAPEPEERDPDEEIPPAPWSFKIMVALAVLYLAWRLVQGVVWVIERVF